MLNLLELDAQTRSAMLQEFEAELASEAEK